MRTSVVVPRWIVVLVLPVVLAVLPAPVRAQPGWYYLPELSLTETFDDNVFGSSSGRESDVITRLSSVLKVGYRSLPLTLLATGALDAEVFAKHPDSSGLNRTQAGVEASWLPLSGLTLRLDGAFTKTETPSELVSNLGVELGRQSTTDLSVTPALSYRLRQTTSLEVGYAYHRTESGDVTTTTHDPRVRLTEQFTRVDLGTLTYGFRVIDTGNSSVSAHLVLVGWARRISPSTSLSLEAGPRIGEDGSLDAEANATFSQRWPSSIATSVTYSRSQLTLPTQTGPSNAQALGVAVTAAPLRSLTLALTASVSSVQQKDETISESAGLAAVYRLTKWLSLVASYRFNRSETRGVAIDHSLVTIGLQARYATRLDD